MEGSPRQAIDFEINIPTDEYGTSNYNTIFGLSTTTYYTARSGPHLSSNTSVPAILPSPIGMEGVPSIPSTLLSSPAVVQNPGATLSQLLGRCYSRVKVKKTIHISLSSRRLSLLLFDYH